MTTYILVQDSQEGAAPVTSHKYGDITCEGQDLGAQVQTVVDKVGFSDLKLVKGTIKTLPSSHNTVDAIIFNWISNSAIDKAHVFKKVFRLLKPGGISLWCFCAGGVLTAAGYRQLLEKVGFIDIQIKSSSEDKVTREKLENCLFFGTIQAKKPIV